MQINMVNELFKRKVNLSLKRMHSFEMGDLVWVRMDWDSIKNYKLMLVLLKSCPKVPKTWT